MRFDEDNCQAGIKALGWYHSKRDDKRGTDLGPDHDWASHSADAFGLGAIVHEEPTIQHTQGRRRHAGAGAWMG
jgi:phage terminase large subunit